MDDTQQSRASDAGATRKRRSSILKSQRPARTPFSELEFNVATPTDTTKSRRVSFSKRTGIAEFVTNEATTTWKTFYEEHNKSLESSNNDSDANASRQPGHLGKRIFSEQFVEYEAVDFLGAHNPPINANMSLHNINFTEQIASLECISDGKLIAPRSGFELSAITDHQSKLFGNDFTVTGIGEMSGRIAVNFSEIQQIPEGDDLDEIERDLGRVSNVVCPGPKDVSEYIEVDLNMTHVMKNDNNISVTDRNPKVQDISKNSTFDKNGGVNKDWVVDKENIAINPYAPCDTENFAINDEPNKVLVFDGKRLTLEVDKPEKVYRKTLLPDTLSATPQRKTIVLNTNDDLPNFADDLIPKNEVQRNPGILNNDLPSFINNWYELEPKTNIGELSFTQALPSILAPTGKDRNTIFEDDISLTQALSTNIITDNTTVNIPRRSVVDHDNDTCNISLTQALPTNIIENNNTENNEKRKTIASVNKTELDNNSRISIVLGKDKCDMPLSANASWRKANAFLLSGLASEEKIQTFEKNIRSVEVEVIPKVPHENPIVKVIGGATENQISNAEYGVQNLREQQRTIVFTDDRDTDMSFTKPIPKIQHIFSDVPTEDSVADMSITKAITKVQNIFSDVPTDARDSDMSFTKPIPKIQNIFSDVPTEDNVADMYITKTITKVQNIFSDDPTDDRVSDMSITKAVPKDQNIFSDIHTDDRDTNMSITKPIPKVQNIFSDVPTDDRVSDMSITKAVPKDQNIFSDIHTDDRDTNMSITKPIPKVQNIFSDVPTDAKDSDMSFTKPIPKIQNIFSDVATEDNVADKSITKAINKVQNIFSDVPTYDRVSDMSITQAVPKVQNIFSDVPTDARDSDMSFTNPISKIQSNFSGVPTDDSYADMSITKAIPKVQNIFSDVPTDDRHADMSITKAVRTAQNVFMDVLPDSKNIDVSITETVPKIQTEKLEKSHNNEMPMVKDIREITEKQILVTNFEKQQRTFTLPDNKDATLSGDKDADMFVADLSAILDMSVEESHKNEMPIVKRVEEMTEKQITDGKQQRTFVFTEDSENADISITEHKVEHIRIKETNKNDVLTVEDINLCKQQKSIINDDAEKSVIKGMSKIENLNEETPEKEMSSLKVDARHDVVNLREKQKVVIIDDNELSVIETMPEVKKIITEKSNKNEILIDNNVKEVMQKEVSNIENVEAVENVRKQQKDIISTNNTVKNMSINKRRSEIENGLELNNVDVVNKSIGRASITKPIPPDVMALKHDVMDISLNKHLDLSGSVAKNANDTKALLDMISHFTDESLCNDSPTSVLPVLTKSVIATEDNEPKVHELKRLSFASNRQSIVISREDMLNSISMAKAVLQKSQMNLDESSLSEDSDEQISEEYSNVPKKPLRISREAVKTLNFDDESINESNIKQSPLRKTAFGETSYMMDSMLKSECNKVNVIPTYDVSDGIKELMSDLVKPMVDVSPHKMHIEHKENNNNRTVTKELQANLATSSQIDMDIDLPTNPTSDYELVEDSHCFKPQNDGFNPQESNNASQKLESYLESEVPQSIVMPFNTEDDNKFKINELCSMEQPQQDIVIVFDQENPLNNVLIRPIDNAHVHKYDPIKIPIPQLSKSDESICGSTYSQTCQVNADQNVPEREVNSRISAEKILEENLTSKDSVNSKHASRDCSVDAYITEVKDTEVNTIIAMKGNTELLAVSSSLTLVDEPITLSKTTSSNDIDDKIVKKSPLRVIFQVDEQESSSNIETLESNTTCNNEDVNMTYNKAKKRNHIPATPTKNAIQNVDITPKPCIKMQKLSLSPKGNQITPEKDVEISMNQMKIDVDRIELKKSPRKSKDKINNSITVQQLLTDYNVDGGINESILDRKILKALQSSKSFKSENSDISSMSSTSKSNACNSLEAVSSFASSKKFNSRKLQSDCSSQSSKNYQPELCSLDSINPDSDSGVNIVAKIDMLPFMGSHECEWDSSSGDTWCFRLLHGRIRLIIGLEHRHDNAIRTRVRADTPIVDVKVETVHQDKKNTVANLCVRFACETLKYMVSRGDCVSAATAARDVPSLLRHGAAVARVALRWGRAMHDAKLHQAYMLDAGGHLSLKVANIPLRSVWEVNMDLELVVENASESPWPRASNVRVNRIVSDVTITPEEVQRLISHISKDWGHVPRTLWRIFKYLKHKTLDDELGLGA